MVEHSILITMKNRFLTYIFLGLAGSMVATSCVDDFADLNTDPTSYSPAIYNPNYLLTSSQLYYTGSTDNAYETWRGNLIYASTMMQQLSSVTSYWAGDKYLLNPDYASAYWEKGYGDQVKVVVEMVEFTRGKEQYKNLHQIARIMRALVMQRITDLYGDIPYFDAGMGIYTKNYFPVYDKQEDIYTDLLSEVEEATNALAPSEEVITGDMIYKGNIDQWKRFGNSLLLRMAMRLTKVQPEKAKEYVGKVVGKTMQSNADNAIIRHDINGQWTTQNRNSIVLLKGPENVQTKLSQAYVNFLKNNDDPRLAVVAITNPSYDNNGNALGGNSDPAVQKGMPNGYTVGTTRNISDAPGYTGLENYSSLSANLLKLDGPTFILTYAESELLLADAAARWNVGGDAATHYNNGTKAAITYFSQYPNIGDLSAAADTYLVDHPYVSANGLEMINTQFWAATLLNGYEAWSNWRRSGFPVLTPVNYPGNATSGTIPRRFPYPTAEANNNPVNYKTAHDAVPGGDLLTGRVWWDAN